MKAILNIHDLQAMGFSRAMAYQLLNRADTPTIRIGGRVFMHAEAFHEWLLAQASHKENA